MPKLGPVLIAAGITGSVSKGHQVPFSGLSGLSQQPAAEIGPPSSANGSQLRTVPESAIVVRPLYPEEWGMLVFFLPGSVCVLAAAAGTVGVLL